jgi:uncharacterized YigZ family protein
MQKRTRHDAADHDHGSTPTPTLAGNRALGAPGRAEVTVKKSLFIGHARAVSTDAEAQAVIAALQKQYWDASHTCYAYVLGRHDEVQRSSDAGEPSGTAGRPILETIKREALRDTIVAVTRYFGGILLGAGGLTRAYGQTATAAIHAASVVRLVPHRACTVSMAYHWHDKVARDLHDQGLHVADATYAEGVTLRVLIPAGREEEVAARLREVTGGQVEFVPGEEVTVAVPDS